MVQSTEDWIAGHRADVRGFDGVRLRRILLHPQKIFPPNTTTWSEAVLPRRTERYDDLFNACCLQHIGDLSTGNPLPDVWLRLACRWHQA